MGYNVINQNNRAKILCRVYLYNSRRYNTTREYTEKKMPHRGIHSGGERGIRTPGKVAPTSHFECDPFDLSGISPRRRYVMPGN